MEKKETILLQFGGKLHIVATFDEVITSVSFSGDFAFSPSEAQGHLEQLLRYQPLDKELLTYMIDSFIKQNDVSLQKVTVSELVEGLFACGKVNY